MDDPFLLFDTWYAEAKAAEPSDPNAMALATANANGAPSVRIVLLKDHDEQGFVFYTNYESRKGAELAANPRAALAFHWKSTYKQVRIEGAIERVAADVSTAYFHSRSRAKQLAAAASRQSRPLPDRETFTARVDALDAKYDGDVPRPDHWGGYRLVPERMEFWEGTQERMHHRRLFVRKNGGWDEGLLYP